MRVGGQRHALADLPTGNSRYPLYRSWVGPMAGLDGCGIRSSDRPARSESLYRLRNITNVTNIYEKQIILSKWYEVLPEEDSERTETYERFGKKNTYIYSIV
jgi:hypothetical protein